MDKRLKDVEASVQKIPELSEKVGELKNWKQIGIVVITALISSVLTGTKARVHRLVFTRIENLTYLTSP